MLKRILFPTDFSEHAVRCMDYILQLKNCGVAEVVVLHVMNINVDAISEIIFEEEIAKETIIANYKKTADGKLKKIAAKFQQAGLKVRTEYRLGVPFVEINQVAEETKASLIVLGHRGHNLAQELLMGSTAEKVARKGSKPVLLIK